jgi:hypothetical protein
MANKSKYFTNPKPLALAVQAALLKSAFPESSVSLTLSKKLKWEGELVPSPLSNIYKIRLDYDLGKRPQVTVIDPKLGLSNGQKPPHLFKEGTLCLYRYSNEWNPGLLLADTILPWTALWLMHYETWLATGKWSGTKQEHPQTDHLKSIHDNEDSK